MKPPKIAQFIGIAATLACSAANAQSKMQQFQAALPPAIRFVFLNYQACALVEMITQEKNGASFEATERAIAARCKATLDSLFRAAASQVGLPPARSNEMLEQFAWLALEERKLEFNHQPIPGETVDPETKQTAECLNSDRVWGALKACFAREGKPLLRDDTDQAETIAEAVEGACQQEIASMELHFTPCLGQDGAAKATRTYVEMLRKIIITAVVQQRAKAPGPHP